MSPDGTALQKIDGCVEFEPTDIEPSDRTFAGWLTVAVADRQGDIVVPEGITGEEFVRIMGGPLLSHHSNKPIGRITKLELREKEVDGEPVSGVYVEGYIFKGDPDKGLKEYPTWTSAWQEITQSFRRGEPVGLSLGGEPEGTFIQCDGRECVRVVPVTYLEEVSLVHQHSRPANPETHLVDHNKVAKGGTSLEKSDSGITLTPEHYEDAVDEFIKAYEQEMWSKGSTALQKPFADYENFDSCVAANSDKDDPEAYCAEIQRRAEKQKTLDGMLSKASDHLSKKWDLEATKDNHEFLKEQEDEDDEGDDADDVGSEKDYPMGYQPDKQDMSVTRFSDHGGGTHATGTSTQHKMPGVLQLSEHLLEKAAVLAEIIEVEDEDDHCCDSCAEGDSCEIGHDNLGDEDEVELDGEMEVAHAQLTAAFEDLVKHRMAKQEDEDDGGPSLEPGSLLSDEDMAQRVRDTLTSDEDDEGSGSESSGSTSGPEGTLREQADPDRVIQELQGLDTDGMWNVGGKFYQVEDGTVYDLGGQVGKEGPREIDITSGEGMQVAKEILQREKMLDYAQDNPDWMFERREEVAPNKEQFGDTEREAVRDVLRLYGGGQPETGEDGQPVFNEDGTVQWEEEGDMQTGWARALGKWEAEDQDADRVSRDLSEDAEQTVQQIRTHRGELTDSPVFEAAHHGLYNWVGNMTGGRAGDVAGGHEAAASARGSTDRWQKYARFKNEYDDIRQDEGKEEAEAFRQRYIENNPEMEDVVGSEDPKEWDPGGRAPWRPSSDKELLDSDVSSAFNELLYNTEDLVQRAERKQEQSLQDEREGPGSATSPKGYDEETGEGDIRTRSRADRNWNEIQEAFRRTEGIGMEDFRRFYDNPDEVAEELSERDDIGEDFLDQIGYGEERRQQMEDPDQPDPETVSPPENVESKQQRESQKETPSPDMPTGEDPSNPAPEHDMTHDPGPTTPTQDQNIYSQMEQSGDWPDMPEPDEGEEKATTRLIKADEDNEVGSYISSDNSVMVRFFHNPNSEGREWTQQFVYALPDEDSPYGTRVKTYWTQADERWLPQGLEWQPAEGWVPERLIAQNSDVSPNEVSGGWFPQPETDPGDFLNELSHITGQKIENVQPENLTLAAETDLSDAKQAIRDHAKQGVPENIQLEPWDQSHIPDVVQEADPYELYELAKRPESEVSSRQRSGLNSTDLLLEPSGQLGPIERMRKRRMGEDWEPLPHTKVYGALRDLYERTGEERYRPPWTFGPWEGDKTYGRGGLNMVVNELMGEAELKAARNALEEGEISEDEFQQFQDQVRDHYSDTSFVSYDDANEAYKDSAVLSDLMTDTMLEDVDETTVASAMDRVETGRPETEAEDTGPSRAERHTELKDQADDWEQAKEYVRQGEWDKLTEDEAFEEDDLDDLATVLNVPGPEEEPEDADEDREPDWTAGAGASGDKPEHVDEPASEREAQERIREAERFKRQRQQEQEEQESEQEQRFKQFQAAREAFEQAQEAMEEGNEDWAQEHLSTAQELADEAGIHPDQFEEAMQYDPEAEAPAQEQQEDMWTPTGGGATVEQDQAPEVPSQFTQSPEMDPAPTATEEGEVNVEADVEFTEEGDVATPGEEKMLGTLAKAANKAVINRELA